jgi:hypothetical protein
MHGTVRFWFQPGSRLSVHHRDPLLWMQGQRPHQPHGGEVPLFHLIFKHRFSPEGFFLSRAQCGTMSEAVLTAMTWGEGLLAFNQ